MPARRVLCLLPLLLATPLAQAGLPVKVLDVRGDDFPFLIHETGLPPPLDDNGLPRAPGCESVRARRVDELPSPWSEAVDRVHMDCQPVPAPSDDGDMLAITAIAFLKPGHVRMAGHPVAEIRMMDSEFWGDHQYVIAERYEQAAADLRALVETACTQRSLRSERQDAPPCRMEEGEGGLYMDSSEIGGIWIHADPDDPAMTVFAEAWAD